MKKKKKHMEVSSFHTCTEFYDQMMYGSWDMLRDWRMDRRANGKNDIQTWEAPLGHLEKMAWLER